MKDNMIKSYLLLDVGGTQIKGSITDDLGNIQGELIHVSAHSRESKKVIFENFAFIIRKLMQKKKEAAIVGVGMAFPGPFDYENGISLMNGINKYDSIYGIPIEEEMKRIIPELQDTKFYFLHDIEAFALGESWFGEVKNEKKILCLCLGTGTGSAFIEDKVALKKEAYGVPLNGWIYNYPYRESIIDDYLSVRGLKTISKNLFGYSLDGKELFDLCKQKDYRALHLYREFGEDLKRCMIPFLDEFRPNAVVMGGQISKSFAYFGQKFQMECDDRNIKVYLEFETSIRAMQGIFIKIKMEERKKC